jgi:putative MFS transporter
MAPAGDQAATDARGVAASRAVTLAVVVAALGYLVDIYDLILFSVVRIPSLTTLGVAAAERADTGIFLLNMQMLGMLLGGILWGVLGDKRGRLSVLFGSIFLYSLANIANGFVDQFGDDSIRVYAAMRFVAGIGLAGELGAGITLVSELVTKEKRGYATAIVAGVGVCGALLAVIVATNATWQQAYWLGGVLGLVLLGLRVGVLESGIFSRVRQTASISRGNFLSLFATRARARRYVAVVVSGLPIWFFIGILVTLSPELGGAMGMDPLPEPPKAVFAAYFGLAIGDFASGVLSNVLRSRRRTIVLSVALNLVAMAAYFTVGRSSVTAFYVVCVFLGIANGYWAVFVTVAAELFGTNLRATATTTAPNFVRGGLTLMTLAFTTIRDGGAGSMWSAVLVGVVVSAVALASVLGIEETFGKDLDFVEE